MKGALHVLLVGAVLAAVAMMEDRAVGGVAAGLPIIPHPALSHQKCLTCHESGLSGAMAVPHAHRGHCTQCHLEVQRRVLPRVASTFVGLSVAAAGMRASQYAPPSMPHGQFMRERCLACHGHPGYPAAQTTHPERILCMQCHVPARPPLSKS